MRRLLRTCAPLLLLAAAACTQDVHAAPAPTCQQPAAALVQRITELAPAGSHFTVVRAAGERATTGESTWWLGIRFTAGGGPPRTGIWAVGGGLSGSGTVLAVDDVAQQWSAALDADTSASRIAKTEGKAVLACL